MFEPPPGFKDLLADAERTPIKGDLKRISVPLVGDIWARPVTPRSAAALAMAGWRKAKKGENFAYLTRFLQDHMGEDEYARLSFEMLDDEEMPEDTMERVMRAIATQGTARPFAAVSTFAVATGNSYRAIRYKLLMAGVGNPMRLPSLHALLDVTEQVVVESLYRSTEEREGPPSKGELKVRDFYNVIYRPDVDDSVDAEAVEEEPYIPPGFEDADDIEDAFDSFLMGGG